MDYIIEGEDSIVRRWLRAGADGWRLDVADELPDAFIEKTPPGRSGGQAGGRHHRRGVGGRVQQDRLWRPPQAPSGGHLDGLMNYPFRNALLAWLLGGDAGQFRESMETIRENYPPAAFYSAMNSLGTHDTPPESSPCWGVGGDCGGESKQWRAEHRLSPEERALGVRRLKLAALVQYAFPGSPTTYYGDEAGMEDLKTPSTAAPTPGGRRMPS